MMLSAIVVVYKSPRYECGGGQVGGPTHNNNNRLFNFRNRYLYLKGEKKLRSIEDEVIVVVEEEEEWGESWRVQLW